MNDLEKLNSTLITEANEILHEYGLLQILSKYGNPIITGSYSLNLMTWRDLDIYLEADEMTEERFFNLGKEIVVRLKAHRMHFRNEFISKTPNLPVGFYWGIYITLNFSDVWKIDVWAIDSNQINLYQKELNDLKSRIDEEKRPIILMIKHHFCKHPEYRRKFAARDIYHAVIAENVNSTKQFSEWLRSKKGILCDFV